MKRNRLNVYSRTTGAYITCLCGEDPDKLLAQAAELYGDECWEWDGRNRPKRED